MRAQKFTRPAHIRCVPGNGVEFVVAHDGQRGSRFDHATHQADGTHLIGATVDEIADEDRLAVGMPPAPGIIAVAHSVQQRLQLVSLSVYVTNDVMAHRSARLHDLFDDVNLHNRKDHVKEII